VDETYDVVVIGGGPAGLSGALALARARRSVLVIDAGEPRNAPAGHVHNYLGREGVPPGTLVATGRSEVAQYGGQVVDGRVESATRTDDGFVVRLTDGQVTRARRLLVATGLVDELPDVPGLAQLWGRDVLHCPYCHGWEVRDQRIGVLSTGPVALHHAHLWRQWSSEVFLLSHQTPAPDAEQAQRLAARGITVVPGEVAELTVVGDKLSGVRLDSGEIVELDAIVVAPRFAARADVLASLGLSPVDVVVNGMVAGSAVPTGTNGATEVPGVWLAGNVTDLFGKVVSSVADGLNAGAAINNDLVTEDTDRAVHEYRHAVHQLLEQDSWEERYRSKPTIWSGNPNAQLVAEAADLRPGRALDVGSGEGADAIWLAQRGWHVTGIDIATTALERAAAHASSVGAEVAERIEWRHVDLRTERPDPGAYDLVSAHFMHMPTALRRDVYARLADAVAPGGTLLIVGHHPSDLRTSAHRMHFPDMMFTAEEVAADLDPSAWDIVAVDTRPRATHNHDGHETTIHDAVVVARRR
jgi:thioredoxin reductase/2-polyprenyl-3-methyl-5-hydroxy-6-metoxy-1,4-benzoquinol methylase